MSTTPYNISIQKPDDEEPMFSNALQLQPLYTINHQNNPSPYTDARIATSGRTGYVYPHISTTDSVNNAYPPIPQVTHFETASQSPSAGMQSSQISEPSETQRRYAAERVPLAGAAPMFTQASLVLHHWSLPNDFQRASTNYYFLNGSPISQGQSPITPITPISTVEPSPTMSLLPSPGSQGSSEALHPSPSPLRQPQGLHDVSELSGAFDQVQPVVFHQHYGSETELSASHSLPQALPNFPYYEDGAISPLVAGTVTRRHSHSEGNTPHPNASPPRFSPYPNTPSLRTRGSARNLHFVDVPLIPRAEYKFEEWSLPGPVVPQTLYQPPTDSDRRRYVEQFQLQQPIYFERVDGPLIGITLVECMTQRFKNLVGQDDELLQNCGPSISVRLNWKGYERYSRQITAKNFKCPQGPVTRKQLAKNVAKTVQKFIDEHIDLPMQQDADHRWQVGPGKVQITDLVLLSLHHVSKGSWQANLCLNQPLEQVLARSFTSQ